MLHHDKYFLILNQTIQHCLVLIYFDLEFDKGQRNDDHHHHNQ